MEPNSEPVNVEPGVEETKTDENTPTSIPLEQLAHASEPSSALDSVASSENSTPLATSLPVDSAIEKQADENVVPVAEASTQPEETQQPSVAPNAIEDRTQEGVKNVEQAQQEAGKADEKASKNESPSELEAIGIAEKERELEKLREIERRVKGNDLLVKQKSDEKLPADQPQQSSKGQKATSAESLRKEKKDKKEKQTPSITVEENKQQPASVVGESVVSETHLDSGSTSNYNSNNSGVGLSALFGLDNAVEPIEIKCTGAEKVKVGDYVLYHIHVTIGEKTIIIKKRFSDILRDLHQPVGKPRHVEGPSRHVFESMQGQNADFIKNRARELEVYFAELLKIPGVPSDPIFSNFFQLYNLEDKQAAQRRLDWELARAKKFARQKHVPIEYKDTAKVVQVHQSPAKDKHANHAPEIVFIDEGSSATTTAVTTGAQSTKNFPKSHTTANNSGNTNASSSTSANQQPSGASRDGTTSGKTLNLSSKNVSASNAQKDNTSPRGHTSSKTLNSSKNIREDANKSPRGEHTKPSGEPSHVSPMTKTRGKSIGANPNFF